jgi:hypothetical protein
VTPKSSRENFLGKSQPKSFRECAFLPPRGFTVVQFEIAVAHEAAEKLLLFFLRLGITDQRFDEANPLLQHL